MIINKIGNAFEFRGRKYIIGNAITAARAFGNISISDKSNIINRLI